MIDENNPRVHVFLHTPIYLDRPEAISTFNTKDSCYEHLPDSVCVLDAIKFYDCRVPFLRKQRVCERASECWHCSDLYELFAERYGTTIGTLQKHRIRGVVHSE